MFMFSALSGSWKLEFDLGMLRWF